MINYNSIIMSTGIIGLIELAIVYIALISPFYYQAGSLSDGDEISKTATGLGQASLIAAVIAIYKIYKSNKKCVICGKKMKDCDCPD